jgi:hypothetical protein
MFSNIWKLQQYAGFVPSEYYLANIMNKAIELKEAEADQHTACLGPDQIAIDNSHKVCIYKIFQYRVAEKILIGEQAHCQN